MPTTNGQLAAERANQNSFNQPICNLPMTNSILKFRPLGRQDFFITVARFNKCPPPTANWQLKEPTKIRLIKPFQLNSNRKSDARMIHAKWMNVKIVALFQSIKTNVYKEWRKFTLNYSVLFLQQSACLWAGVVAICFSLILEL